MASRWKWRVRGYYANNVKPPKSPGALALEVRHNTDSRKDAEVAAFQRRRDIGRIEVDEIDRGGRS